MHEKFVNQKVHRGELRMPESSETEDVLAVVSGLKKLLLKRAGGLVSVELHVSSGEENCQKPVNTLLCRRTAPAKIKTNGELRWDHSSSSGGSSSSNLQRFAVYVLKYALTIYVLYNTV